MQGGFPVSDQYMDWYLTELRRTEQAEETARRLASDFLVFVSYSWADTHVAQAVTTLLDDRGIRYVQDRKDVNWGDRISQWAHEEIKRSTHYLLILTGTSAASTWCAYEYGVAAALERGLLVFIAEPALDVPPFAAGHAAVRELRDVGAFFANARIDESEVARFIEEILATGLDELASYVPRADGELPAWDAPDRREHEAVRVSVAESWAGDSGAGPERLLAIKIDESDHRLIVEAKARHTRLRTYEFIYAPELTAVRVTPEKQGSAVIGVRDESGADGPQLRPGGRGVRDALSGKRVYGWPASADFWERSLRRLQQELPS
jgi:hypothetical protein